jgi:hypothetical protein
MTYTQKLEASKEFYPFTNWRELEEDLPQYTAENCSRTQQVLDGLIDELVRIGEAAEENQKVALFEKAVTELNALNEEIEGLIETGEREELCDLFNKITVAAGLDPEKYGEGEGIASEWREW